MKTISARVLRVIAAVVAVLDSGLATAAAVPTHLRCEYRTNPLGVDTARPRLSWWIESDRRGERQTAYQIAVAGRPEDLATGRFDLWDSGRVTSSRSVHVAYGGKTLTSRQRAHWQVRVWDRDGEPSAWSAPASWSMGLLDPDDWQARWIAATDRLAAPRRAVAGYHALEARAADDLKWVQVDLGAERPVDTIRLGPPAPSGFASVKGFGFPVRFRLEAARDPDFREPQIVADFTQADYPNPGNESRAFAGQGVVARYVRVTATRLWNRQSGPEPFCFALAELEVLSHGTNAALHAPVRAKDSVEASGWGRDRLTDGVKLPDATDHGSDRPGNAAVLLRKEFVVPTKVVRATAYLCGLGYAELEFNGRKIGDAVLDPGFTDYSRRVLYRTYDVTEALRAGTNAVGVMLGGGWFNLATPDLFGFESAPWSASPRTICRLDLEFADGRTEAVVSDGSWKWSTGAIAFNCVRGGETIDARAETPGWSVAGYDDSAWPAAIVVGPPAGRLVSQQHPPIRATAAIRPVGLTEPKPGVYVFDLGVNIAGWARLTTRGPRGTTVALEYNELLNPDGTVNTRQNTSHTHGRFQTEEFILKGEGVETFEPRFTYHGFRYVQVTGLSEKPTLDTLTGRWVTTAPGPAGEFACSDERINELQQVFVRTFLNNLHGIPTDCPQREKMGWMNDGCVCMEALFYNLETPLFYQKWFRDMLDAQDPNGHVPDFVPTCGWGRTRPDGSPGEMADPWWGGAIVLAPWKLYQHYGDTRVLEEGYGAMKAYVDYLTSTAKDHVVAWGLGDWLDESAGGGGRRVPVVQTSTAAYAYYAGIVSRTASLLGRPDDARHYAGLEEAIRAAFNAKFLDASSGFYARDSQTAQALPLALGLVPKDLQPAVRDRLIESITGSRRNHVSSGIVGTLYLFKALMEQGRDDLAWAMIAQEDYPGWRHMINQGGTSVWEAWNGDASRNHPTFGCVGFWFYEGVAGIRPDPEAPGFERIVIRPAIVGGLAWAKGSYASVRGRIESHWRRQGTNLHLEIAIPGNTTATVHLPTGQPDAVTESGRSLAQAEGVKFLRHADNAVVVEVGSGRYAFTAPSPGAGAATP